MVQTVDCLRHVFLVSVFPFTNYIVFIFFLGLQNNEAFGGTTIFIDVNGAVALC